MKRLFLFLCFCCLSCQEEPLLQNSAMSASMERALTAFGETQALAIPWNSGLGLLEAAEEALPFGPTAIAADAHSIWVLDQLNHRALSVTDRGVQATLALPPGVEGLALDGDHLWAMSLINHRATSVSQKTGAIEEEVELPKPLAIANLQVQKDELLMLGSYQNTFSLGQIDARLSWPTLLSTQKKGLPGPDGVRFQTKLLDGVAYLVKPAEKGAGLSVALEMPSGVGRLRSASLLQTLSHERAVILAEFGSPVERAILLYDAKGHLLDFASIESDPLYWPRTEFAVVPVDEGAILYQLRPLSDALWVHRFALRSVR